MKSSKSRSSPDGYGRLSAATMTTNPLGGTFRGPICIACIFALALLAACQSPIEKHRAAIESVYGQLRVLDATVRDAPPLQEDSIDTGGARIVLEGTDPNALFVAWVHLATPEKAGPYGTGTKHTDPIQTCGMALTGQTQFRTEDVVASHLQQCAGAEYAFVLRTQGVEYPKISDEQNLTYSPGWYDGEVRLYRLADGAPLGGFRVSARNGEEIGVYVGKYGAAAEITNALSREIDDQIDAQIVEGLRKFVPGSVP